MLVAGISVGALIVLILSGVPVAFAFAATVVLMVVIFGYDPAFLVPYSFNRMSTLVILAIPFFILAGGLMEKGGITKPLIDFVDSVVSRVRGGLGAVGSVSCGLFGAISGSSSAAICCIGPIMIPRMVEEGYPRGYATSLITSAAGLAVLIPPSFCMILYGWLTYTSVTACFLAGTFPGIVLMLLFILINWIMVGRMPVKKPRPWGSIKQAGKEITHAGWRALPALMMPLIILGSIYGGIATPTEAAAVAVFIAIPMGFLVYKGLTPKVFADSLIESGVTIGTIMLLFFCAMMIGRVFVMEQIPLLITNFILGISENKYIVLLLVNAILIIFGMFVDDITSMIIAAPMLLPVVQQIGISPVHFAAIITTNVMMGCYTPPMAVMLYIGQRVGGVSFDEMLKPSLMFVAFAYLPTVMITTYWPPIAEWLPKVVLGAKVLGIP